MTFVYTPWSAAPARRAASLVLCLGLEGREDGVLKGRRSPHPQGQHGAQDRAGPVHHDVLGVGVAAAAPLEARRQHGVEVATGVVEGEDHHGGGKEGVNGGRKLWLEFPESSGAEAAGAGQQRLDQEAKHHGHLQVSRTLRHVSRLRLRHPQPPHPPTGDHSSGELAKYFEKDVEGPRPALHVLLQEGVGAGACAGPTPLPPHDEQEHAEAPRPDAEVCVDEGQFKGDSTHLGGGHHLEEAAPEQLVPDPPAEEAAHHVRHP